MLLAFPSFEVLQQAEFKAPQSREGMHDFAFSPDGTYLVGLLSRYAYVWKTADLSQPPVKHAHPKRPFRVMFTPDGTRTVTSCADNVCRVFPLHSVDEPLLKTPHRVTKNGYKICQPVFDATGRLVTWDSGVVWTSLETGEQQRCNAAATPFQLIGLPQDDVVIAATTGDAVLCRPGHDADLLDAREHLASVVNPVYGSVIMGGAYDPAQLWRPGSETLQESCLYQPNRTLAMGISRDGRLVAVADYTSRIAIWRWPDNDPFHDTIPSGTAASCGYAHADSRRVLVKRTQENVQVHSLETGEADGPPIIPNGTLIEAAWSSGNAAVITLSHSGASDES